MVDEPEIEIEGLPLRERPSNYGARLDDLVAARLFPHDAIRSYYACKLRQKPKILEYDNLSDLESADLASELIAAASTHTHVDIMVRDDMPSLPSSEIVYAVSSLFGFRTIGVGRDGLIVYTVRLYTYLEVPLEEGVDETVQAGLARQGLSILDEEEEVLH